MQAQRRDRNKSYAHEYGVYQNILHARVAIKDLQTHNMHPSNLSFRF